MDESSQLRRPQLELVFFGLPFCWVLHKDNRRGPDNLVAVKTRTMMLSFYLHATHHATAYTFVRLKAVADRRSDRLGWVNLKF
jgi:hypothetical protein